jgi:hypothetical protein
MKQIIKLTESDLHNIVNESVKRILKEDRKGVDVNNVVSEDNAVKFGFSEEYCGFEQGLELWGKDVTSRKEAKMLLKQLLISRFTTESESDWGLHVRITVKPNPPKREFSFRKKKDKIGDYYSTGYGDSQGEFFHNPKTNHTKRFPFEQ